ISLLLSVFSYLSILTFLLSAFFFCIILRPPSLPLFPYTTLFRSVHRVDLVHHPLVGDARGVGPEQAILQVLPRVPRKYLEYRLRSEEHTSELQSLAYLVCRLLLEKKKNRQV